MRSNRPPGGEAAHLGQTWLRFVRHSRRFGPEAQVGPWLFAVARNLAVSYFRRRTVEAKVIGSLSLWPERLSETPFHMTARSEFERRLEAALAALPPLLREALLLTAIEGLTSSEAAAICGVSGEAMRQRVRRARAQLARDLGEIASGWPWRSEASRCRATPGMIRCTLRCPGCHRCSHGNFMSTRCVDVA